MNLNIEYEQERDGRWIAEIPQLPGVLCYGDAAESAMVKSEILALRVIAEQLKRASGIHQLVSNSRWAA